MASSLRDWHEGAYLDAEDALILDAAHGEAVTLVTYDARSIPMLLKDWAEASAPHGGVIFVDERTLRPHDVGGLMHTLRRLVADLGELDWENRVVSLSRYIG